MAGDRCIPHCLGKYFRCSALVAVVLSMLPVGDVAWAGNGPEGNEGAADPGAVRLLKAVPICREGYQRQIVRL